MRSQNQSRQPRRSYAAPGVVAVVWEKLVPLATCFAVKAQARGHATRRASALRLTRGLGRSCVCLLDKKETVQNLGSVVSQNCICRRI